MTVPFAFQEIKIVEVAEAEVGRPRTDGTRGAALYEVPFRLSAVAPPAWAELFVAIWDHPPEYTSMHRPGIASVFGDRIILDGTTLEEVERVHGATLKLVVSKVNEEYVRLVEKQERAHAREQAAAEEHRKQVSERAKRITFD